MIDTTTPEDRALALDLADAARRADGLQERHEARMAIAQALADARRSALREAAGNLRDLADQMEVMR
jgi:hypothetical protein